MITGWPSHLFGPTPRRSAEPDPPVRRDWPAPHHDQVTIYDCRISGEEYDDLTAAAARVELTTTGYVAEAALAAARGQTTPGQADGAGVTHAELAQLQRELFAARTALTKVGSNLNQAVAVLNSIGRAPTWLDEAVERCRLAIQDLDTVVTAVDGRLR